jgi:hypothetical protein
MILCPFSEWIVLVFAAFPEDRLTGILDFIRLGNLGHLAAVEDIS